MTIKEKSVALLRLQSCRLRRPAQTWQQAEPSRKLHRIIHSRLQWFLGIGGWVLTVVFSQPFMETAGERISTSVMFQRTHARLWLLSSSWTVKSLVSSWFVSGKAWPPDWISLVVFSGEQVCVQFGYSQTDGTVIVTLWLYCRTKKCFAEAYLKIHIERKHSQFSFFPPVV